jgi:uncharacterized membrane protein HdeD (DUF308 family)
MTYRMFLAAGFLLAGVLAIASGIFAIAGDEIAMAVLTFLIGAGVIAGGVYSIGAGVVLLTHETWIARAVERLKQ